MLATLVSRRRAGETPRGSWLIIPDMSSVVLEVPAARDWEFPRAVAGVALLVRYARSRGIEPRAVLAGSGLRVEDLDRRDGEVTATQELCVVRNLQRRLPECGVAVGATYVAETFGAFGYALLASRTVLDAMNVALRFIDLSHAFAIPSVEVVGDDVVVTVDGRAIPADVRRFLVARDASAIDHVLAGLVPGGVGARLELGEDHAVLTLRAVELGRPLPRGDARARDLAEALCGDVVARRRERAGIAQDTRVLITQRLPWGAPMTEVAAALGLSERTLRRRLAAAGVSYQTLLDEVREALAGSLLGGRATLPVAEVATRLGYADASSFIHAHRRWTGQSPTERRRGRVSPVVQQHVTR